MNAWSVAPFPIVTMPSSGSIRVGIRDSWLVELMCRVLKVAAVHLVGTIGSWPPGAKVQLAEPKGLRDHSARMVSTGSTASARRAGR